MAKLRGSLGLQLLLICCVASLLVSAHADAAAPSPSANADVPAPSPSAHANAAAPSPSSAPVVQHHKWNVEYIMWAPDCNQIVMIGINGKFPGPTITANAGDRIRVEVTNHLHTEGLVIHWHGIKQIGTPWADGTASISQCPIDPEETFTYDFLADKPGTFFYHGHFGMQRSAGLYGTLIVKGTDKQMEPFAKDYNGGELNMLLSDWYHKSVYAQAAGLDGKNDRFQWVGDPDTLLINGRGQYGCSLGKTSDDQKVCDSSKTEKTCEKEDTKEMCELQVRRSECGPFCEGTQCSPVVFEVEAGKTYRLRIASTTSLCALNVQVQGHGMTVVEADGNFVTPLDVENINIYSGESYSVLLKANQTPSSYWISVGVIGRESKTQPALAILKYTDPKADSWPARPPPETPSSRDEARSKDFANKLTALQGTTVTLPAATRHITMLNTQNMLEDGGRKWAINHVSLSLPGTPYLGAYVYGIENIVFDAAAESPANYDPSYNIHKPSNAQAPAPALTPVTMVSSRVFKIANASIVDVVLQNANMLTGISESHPWHLHGHDFWVLGYGDGVYDYDEAIKKKQLNLKNPPLRNTVVLFPSGWTAIRFVADNPGVWAFHCHIEQHLHMGMGVIFAEGMEKVRELKVPREAITCGVAAKRQALIALAPAAMAPSAGFKLNPHVGRLVWAGLLFMVWRRGG